MVIKLQREHPGVRRSLPWEPSPFPQSSHCTNFPVYIAQVMVLPLGEAAGDVKTVIVCSSLAPSSGYMILAPNAFLKGCLCILAVILGTDSHLSLSWRPLDWLLRGARILLGRIHADSGDGDSALTALVPTCAPWSLHS